MLKVILHSILSGLIVFSSLANAQPTPVKPPAALAVDPESLRHAVLEGNLPLYQQLKAVEDAKSQVDIARANLYPSLNLSGMLTGGTSFILSSIQFLLPFLVPANHFALDQAQDQLQADMISYKVIELNTYSSALSVYYTVLADQKLLAVYKEEADNLLEIYKALQLQQSVFGDVNTDDIAQAKANADLAQDKASIYAGSVATEVANLRQALGLPLSTKITLVDGAMPPSAVEGGDPQQVVDQVLSLAPENQQIDYLIKAAEAGYAAKQFGFINSFTASGASNGDGSVSTGKYNVTGGINFGLNYFPTVELAANSVDEIRLQKISLQQADTALIESALANVVEAKKQYEYSHEAFTLMQGVYDNKKNIYESGTGSLLDVLNAHTQLTQAATSQVQAEMNLNLYRVTLHRALISDQFAKIQGCKAQPQVFSGISGIFQQHDNKRDLDVVCREGGYVPYQP